MVSSCAEMVMATMARVMAAPMSGKSQINEVLLVCLLRGRLRF